MTLDCLPYDRKWLKICNKLLALEPGIKPILLILIYILHTPTTQVAGTNITFFFLYILQQILILVIGFELLIITSCTIFVLTFIQPIYTPVIKT